MAASLQDKSDPSTKNMVFSQGGLEEEVPGKILQVPFAKISVEDRAQNLPHRLCVEAAVQDPCARLSVQGA